MWPASALVIAPRRSIVAEPRKAGGEELWRMEEQGYEAASGMEAGPTQAGLKYERPSPRASNWKSDLRRTILSRVVPRMAEARAALLASPDLHRSALVSPEQVVQFAELVLKGAVPAIVARIEALCLAGLGLEAVLLQLMTQAARQLGELWAQDSVSFIDVTAGISRLQGSSVRWARSSTSAE